MVVEQNHTIPVEQTNVTPNMDDMRRAIPFKQDWRKRLEFAIFISRWFNTSLLWRQTSNNLSRISWPRARGSRSHQSIKRKSFDSTTPKRICSKLAEWATLEWLEGSIWPGWCDSIAWKGFWHWHQEKGILYRGWCKWRGKYKQYPLSWEKV